MRYSKKKIRKRILDSTKKNGDGFEGLFGKYRPFEYEYTEGKVTIQGERMKAYYPVDHTAVKGVVLFSKDRNAHDSWANRRDMVRAVYILWNDEEDWQMWSRAQHHFTEGMLRLFFLLEDDDYKEAVMKEFKILKLKDRMKNDKLELEELTGEKANA